MVLEGWEKRTLSSLADYHNGRAFKPQDWGKEGLPIIRIAQMTNPIAETDFYSGDDIEAKHKINNGDMLFSWSATLAVMVWNRSQAVLNQHIFKVEEKPGIYNDFLYYLLDNSIDALAEHSHGSTMKHIKKGVLKDFIVPVPPFHEQKKIATILSSVDDAIQATQAVIDQTRRVKQGLLQQLLTRGIGHTRFKQTEIGEIPEEWELIPFDQVLDVRSGKGFRLDEYVDEGIKLLRIDNVSWGKITWDSIAYLPTHYADEYPELLLKEGDILLALNRPITQGKLKLAILKREDSPAILYQRVGKILFKNENIEENFTYQLLNYLLPPFIMEKSVGSDQPFINITTLRKLKLPIPTINEQLKIAAILDQNDDCIETHNKSLENLFSIKRGLMQDLLTGRVRVKLDGEATT